MTFVLQIDGFVSRRTVWRVLVSSTGFYYVFWISISFRSDV